MSFNHFLFLYFKIINYSHRACSVNYMFSCFPNWNERFTMSSYVYPIDPENSATVVSLIPDFVVFGLLFLGLYNFAHEITMPFQVLINFLFDFVVFKKRHRSRKGTLSNLRTLFQVFLWELNGIILQQILHGFGEGQNFRIANTEIVQLCDFYSFLLWEVGNQPIRDLILVYLTIFVEDLVHWVTNIEDYYFNVNKW